jgi:Cytochrome c554 and c-prime
MGLKNNIQGKRSLLMISSITLGIFLLARCVDKDNHAAQTARPPGFTAFAGSASCTGCHLHSAHYLTSGIASEKNIKGSFESGRNSFDFSNGTVVAMEKNTDGKYYQVAYVNGVEKKRRRFDIVIGSATKGQSYLSWVNDRLVQLPITYFTANDQWCNSPGYPYQPAFNRPITSRCMECHTTFSQVVSTPDAKGESFDANKMIYGISCEKCHGPAAEHVAFQTKHPEAKEARFIINPAKFNRRQLLDLCALCHGGRLQKTQPSFSFTAGDSLARYFTWDTSGMQTLSGIDVHGNQYGLLKQSKCFTMSNTLTCNTCHDAHANEKGQTVVFSQRCMSCHSTVHEHFSKINHQVVTGIKQDCISCHMPKQTSRSIAVLLEGATTPTAIKMHTHFITVYPEETNHFKKL